MQRGSKHERMREVWYASRSAHVSLKQLFFNAGASPHALSADRADLIMLESFVDHHRRVRGNGFQTSASSENLNASCEEICGV